MNGRVLFARDCEQYPAVFYLVFPLGGVAGNSNGKLVIQNSLQA